MPEYSNYVETRQPVEDADVDGSELLGVSKAGTAKRLTVQQVVNLAVTREIGRVFLETLVFDVNEIEVTQHTMTDDIDFIISATGNLVDESSSMIMEIVADGIHALNFLPSVGGVFSYIYPAGVVSGVILDAGTYEIYIYFLNGRARVNIPGVSLETSGLVALLAPGSFTVTADGEDALDLSWTDVDNETNYQIEKSSTGTGGWTVYSNPVADATSDTETGLSANETVYYRIKAVGDGIVYADSPYATASGTTEDSGDVTAPTFTFNPANGNAVWTVNKPLTITANEELRNSADNSLIDSSDLATIITLKETNSGGANITFTATIDATKKIITVTPTAGYGANQLVYLAINNVEDVSGNAISLTSITFTTTDLTYLNGTSNYLHFGDILDTIFAVNDTNFWIYITTKNIISSTRIIVSKNGSTNFQRCFTYYFSGTDMIFQYWMGEAHREVKWQNCIDSSEHDWVLKYDGSIDTNNGLDRCILLKDGATVGSKIISSSGGIVTGTLQNVTAPLGVGAAITTAGAAGAFYSEELAGFKIKSSAGAVTEIDVPIILDGLDISGNARHGTWV